MQSPAYSARGERFCCFLFEGLFSAAELGLLAHFLALAFYKTNVTCFAWLALAWNDLCHVWSVCACSQPRPSCFIETLAKPRQLRCSYAVGIHIKTSICPRRDTI